MSTSFSPNHNKIRLSKHLNTALSLSLKNNLFVLPPIDSETKKKALMEPTSMLTRFVQNRTRSLINCTKEEFKRSMKMHMLTSMNYNTQKKNKTLDKKFNIFLTHNEIDKNNSNNNNINNNNIKKKESESESSQTLDKEEKEKNLFLSIIDNMSSLTVDKPIKENYMKALIPKFRRTRIYQPIISENWKFKNGLRVTIGSQKVNSLPIKNDIEYQYKIINDEYKLLEDNYTFYKTRIIIKDNYYDSFKILSLKSKINYNKTLEEAIGLLYLLPQLLLDEFYKLIQNYSSVNIPNSNLFKEKYVFDEVKNLIYNNSLLIKVYDFFKSCYEVYSTLIKEVNDMCLETNAFINVINCLEKVRYNLSYVSTASNNAIKNYNEDLKYIQKIKNDKSKSKSIDITEKMRNQFAFKKNDEKQRRLRIETALDNKYDNENFIEDLKKKENGNEKNKFISFIDSKLINKLMKHFTKEVKNEITTQRINKEIDGYYEDGQEIKEKHKVIKINF